MVVIALHTVRNGNMVSIGKLTMKEHEWQHMYRDLETGGAQIFEVKQFVNTTTAV